MARAARLLIDRAGALSAPLHPAPLLVKRAEADAAQADAPRAGLLVELRGPRLISTASLAAFEAHREVVTPASVTRFATRGKTLALILMRNRTGGPAENSALAPRLRLQLSGKARD